MRTLWLSSTALLTFALAPVFAQQPNGNPVGPAYNYGIVGNLSGQNTPYITSTGGTKSRALADKLGDTLSVKDFGAVGDGVTDDTAAINAAASLGANGGTVLLPAGTFRITQPITLKLAQSLICSSHGATHITVDADFSPSATGVVLIQGEAPEVRDCDIEFHQAANQTIRGNFAALGSCTTTANGTGCKYPWAIAPGVGGVNRPRLVNNRVGAAWNGIDMNGVTGFWLDDNEVSALNIGYRNEGGTDGCHVRGLHLTPLNIPGSGSSFFGTSSGLLFPAVYGDGNTIGAQFGRCDGMTVDDLITFQAAVQVLGTTTNIGMAHVHLDGAHANMTVAGGAVRLIETYSTKPATDSNSVTDTDIPLRVSGGVVTLTTGRLEGGNHAPQIQNDGGYLTVSDVTTGLYSADTQAIVTTGGYTLARNNLIDPNSAENVATVYTQPMIQQAGGQLDAQGNKFLPPVAGASGTAIQITVDTTHNAVANNDLAGWGYVLPANPFAGTYGPNGGSTAFAWTPVVGFAGADSSGTAFSPTYSARKGYWWPMGDGIHFSCEVQWTNNAYAQNYGSAFAFVQGLPFTLGTVPTGSVNAANVSVLSWSGFALSANENAIGAGFYNSNTLALQQYGYAGQTNVTQTNVPPSANTMKVVVSGVIPNN